MSLPIAALLAASLLGTPDPYELGLQRYREADYLAAAEAFRESVAHPSTAQREARANLWLGVCLFNISETDAARLAFKSALIGDPTLTLPDEAPPTVQPLFDDVRRSLVATAPAQPAPSVPSAKPDVAVAASEPVIIRGAPSQEASESRSLLRPWMAGAALGLAGGLGVTAGGLELGANTNFNSAAASRYATTTTSLINRGTGEQNGARVAGVAALTVLAGAAVLYFLSH
jgi:hypothetical protein